MHDHIANLSVMTHSVRNMMLPRRFYLPRCIGLGLGFLAVYPSLPTVSSRHDLALVLLLAYCFLWPHAAYLLAKASSTPIGVERRNMLVDACAAGFFAGLTGFDPIPSVAIVSMVSMNNMATGGPRFMLMGVLLSLFGAILGYLVIPPGPDAMAHREVLTCIPLLILYPLSVGYVCYRTARSLQYQKKQLSIMSRTDYLTGLLNRSALNEIMEEFIDDQGVDLPHNVVALIDVDGFKQINDRLGHSAGDGILQEITNIMRSCTRAQDTIGRYGGDEFCVILRDVNRAEALQILERMRARAHAASLTKGNTAAALGTLSIGAAFYHPLSNTVAKWIDRADYAMYEAKRNGRNQIFFTA
jgi:diguanylate cyclase